MKIYSPQVPALVIDIGIAEPPDPAEPGCSGLQVWGAGERARAYCFEFQGQYRVDIPTVASFGFAVPTDVVTAIPHRPTRPELIHETYLRTVLPLVLQAGGAEVLHASAVHMSGGVVALCGASRVGKSTTAVALNRRGYPLWADDVVALDMTGSQVNVMPLPFELRLRPQAATFFGEKPGATRRMHPSGTTGTGMESEPARLLALCVLLGENDSHDGIAVERLGAAAVPMLLTHAYCYSLQAIFKRRMMEHYLELVVSVPVFAIRFRPGLERLPTIVDVIEQVAGREA